MLIFISIGFRIIRNNIKSKTKNTNKDCYNKSAYDTTPSKKHHNEKIFDTNEGEYVEFEEIKENK